MSDGFLSRWARRKEAVKAAEQNVEEAVPVPSPLSEGVPGGGGAEGPAPLNPEPPPAPPSSPQGRGEERAPDAHALDDRGSASEVPADAQPLLDLPSLDTLTPETDLTPFLRTGVPSALRNAALRRMWSLDPSIRDFVSEAREYAYDWNTPGGVPGLGPLLPSDDVKAMLGRLFRDPAEVANPIAEPGADAPSDPSAESSEAVIALAGEETDGEASAAEAEPIEAPVASAEPKRAEPARPEPRLRRHGGARPA